MSQKVDVVKQFKEKRALIKSNIDLLKSKGNGSISKENLDEIIDQVDQIKKFVHSNLSQMVAYDTRTCNEAIKELEVLIAEERSIAANAKPFKFSFNLKGNNIKPSPALTVPGTGDELDSSASVISSLKKESSTGFNNLNGQEQSLHSDQVDSKEILLESLQNCTIHLYGAPSALRMIKLRDCRIYCGPVSSSVFISDCQGCSFRLIAQQARIHDTFDCELRVHISSRSIIENCSRLKFGQLDWHYDGLEGDFEKAGLVNLKSTNNWNQVDDFNVLSGKSPNWDVIEDVEK